jgi:hypothetical protein
LFHYRYSRIRRRLHPHDSHSNGTQNPLDDQSSSAVRDTQSQSFDLTTGEFELNDQDKSKSTGVLHPLCQLAMDKQGQLQFQLNQNPWNLVDVIDWKGTAGVN